MLKRLSSYGFIRHTLFATLAVSLNLCLGAVAIAQTETGIEDGSADPIKLFERGQNAHARGDLDRAIEFYEEALKLRPEFPEAEFQRGTALVTRERFADAEAAFKRAIELRANWAAPHFRLGLLLVRLNRDNEAEPALRQALKFDLDDQQSPRVLAEIRLRAGDARQALEFARRATTSQDSPAAAWIIRALAERSLGAKADAIKSLDQALALTPENVMALLERAELLAESKGIEAAEKDLREIERLSNGDKPILARVAQAYEKGGRSDEARRIAESAKLFTATDATQGGKINGVLGSPEEIESANSEDPAVARKALKTLIDKNPNSAMLSARLGHSYRTDDPALSLEYYRRAATIEPANAEYATGYASALVQSRNFAEAIRILRRVIAAKPDNYAAHANLATALYKQKLYAEALVEYDWILKQRPDLVIAYYFIATAHDYLGEYPEALVAYESFVTKADAQLNQLEIEKVKLRLPSLRRQIQLRQGVKRKTASK